MADETKQQKETPTAEKGDSPDSTSGKQAEVRTFTQDELNAIVKDRLDRERDKHKKDMAEKYGDYDALKEAAAEWQKAQDDKKSDMEKLSDQLAAKDTSIAELQARLEAAEQERVETLIRAQVIASAVARGFKDPEDAYRLVDLSKIVLGDEGITGVSEALDGLAEAKPYLLRDETTTTTPPKVPKTNLPAGQSHGESDEERRRRLYGLGSTPFGQGQGGGLFMPDKNATKP